MRAEIDPRLTAVFEDAYCRPEAPPWTVAYHHAQHKAYQLAVGLPRIGAFKRYLRSKYSERELALMRDSRAWMCCNSATLSLCGRYRYTLTRRWDERFILNIVMLNPSTADAHADDPTIRRCIAFAKEWGYGSVVVTNLFAYRATDPRELLNVADPVGTENRAHLVAIARGAAKVVCAWGVPPARLSHQEMFVKAILREHATLHALGFTKAGHPKHPLYLPKTTEPVEWIRRAA